MATDVLQEAGSRRAVRIDRRSGTMKTNSCDGSAPPERELRELHRRYTQYLKDLARDVKREHPILAYGDFVRWWHGLSPTVRNRFAKKYRKGYRNVIRDGKREIAEFVMAQDS